MATREAFWLWALKENSGFDVQQQNPERERNLDDCVCACVRVVVGVRVSLCVLVFVASRVSQSLG